MGQPHKRTLEETYNEFQRCNLAPKWKGNGRSAFRATCPVCSTRLKIHVANGTKGADITGYCNKCGAKWPEICKQGGLNLAQRYAKSKAEIVGAVRVLSEYVYHDESGEPIWKMVRQPPGSHRKQLPFLYDADTGEYRKQSGIDGGGRCRRVLYRLPELIAANESGASVVYMPEGEKDVETVRGLDLVATCLPFNKWEEGDPFAPFLKGKIVHVLQDNDPTGRDHANILAGHLVRIGAAEVRIILLPGLKRGGDVTDWIKAGHTAEELQGRVNDTPLWTPGVEQTDTTNAERILQDYGDDLRVSHQKRTTHWFIFSRGIWKSDSHCEARTAARITARRLQIEAARMKDTDSNKKMMARHALQSESAPRLDAMVRVLESFRPIQVDLEDFNTHPEMFNCLDGTFDMPSGEEGTE